jgi:hypothetical protein
LFGFAINCSSGIEPTMHDWLPGAAGGNHAQRNSDGRYFSNAGTF